MTRYEGDELSLYIGNRVAEERIARGLTQQAVADGLGIHRTTYLEIEKGCRALKIQRLYELAEVLQINPFLLLPGLKESQVSYMAENHRMRTVIHQIASLVNPAKKGK